jgi:hypothetical protein
MIQMERVLTYFKFEIQMRKAARKQKKLEKSNQPSIKLDKNSTFTLPPSKEIHVFCSRRPVSDENVFVARHEMPGFAYALAQNESIEILSCTSDEILIANVSEALKLNTTIQSLQLLQVSHISVLNHNQYMKNILHHVAEILPHNRLTTLNLSIQDPNLQGIQIHDNLCEFTTSLKNNTSLTCLTLPILKYQVQQLDKLVEAISNHPQLVDLTFPPGHQAGPDAWKSFSSVVSANCLKNLSVETRYNFFEDYSAGPLCEALKHNTSLKSLSLAQKGPRSRQCVISQQECLVLFEALSTNQTLTKLDINGMELGSENMSKILDSLQRHTSLTQLNFWENRLTGHIAASLASFLEINESLTELDLPNSHLDATACQLIGPALKKNRSITSLNFFMNPIESEGCKYLAEAIKFNKTLIRVDLKESHINDEGCKYLGEAIKTNPCLLHLDISGPEIRVHGFKALIDGMKENESLTELTVSRAKSVPRELHEEILNAQKRNKQYQRDLIVNTMLIQIARSDAFDQFPLEIWLRIFKYFVCGGVPGFNHIAESILMHSDVQDVKSLCQMKIIRINGKSHLVSKNIQENT